jgi:ABC-type multidrug transport system fused ATPase/permease subunit
MRRHAHSALPGPQPTERHDWQTVRTLFPYIWTYRWRVLFALSCLICAKLANVGVPIVFKNLIDALDIGRDQALIVVPAALLVAYGVLRFSTSMFTELRELIFARVTQQAVRNIALEVFRHLHAVAALPPRSPDGRHHARHRTRHARHRFEPAVVHAVLDHADDHRVRARRGGAARAVRLALPGLMTLRLRVAIYIAFTIDRDRTGAWTSAARPTNSTRRRTRARSTACSTTRR